MPVRPRILPTHYGQNSPMPFDVAGVSASGTSGKASAARSSLSQPSVSCAARSAGRVHDGRITRATARETSKRGIRTRARGSSTRT
ncbi:MAG: hypothetical protein DME33_01615 [Verrucomicrobia bacterium]|nr:MAG: hypothetical protein DME33_01615 [Verrucomicrobiota bacterium]